MIFPLLEMRRKPPINIGGFCIEMIAFKNRELPFKQLKGHAMVGCRSILAYGGTMGFCGISFVSIPVIHGILFMQSVHIVVSICFR